MNYGTYSTMDCPTGGDKKILSAKLFLSDKFREIGGTVRVLQNPHDFGTYPSFEIDYPADIEEISNNEDEAEPEDYKKLREWIDRAAEIEQEYNKKFEDNL